MKNFLAMHSEYKVSSVTIIWTSQIVPSQGVYEHLPSSATLGSLLNLAEESRCVSGIFDSVRSWISLDPQRSFWISGLR